MTDAIGPSRQDMLGVYLNDHRAVRRQAAS
jgi:hypothetical protein